MALSRTKAYGPLTQYSSGSDWLKMPEWAADDEFADARSYAWIVLTDAILKSIMTNDPERGKVLTSISAVSDMVESRTWLMDDSNSSGLSSHLCISMLGISDMVLKQLLRHLWLRWDRKIGGTTWKSLKAARAGIKRETRRNSRGIRGPKRMKSSREHAVLMRAAEVRRESMLWVEEGE